MRMKKRNHTRARGGPTDFTYITPSQAFAFEGNTRSITELEELAGTNEKCAVCGQPAWRYAGLGMCFPCTTGESDASGDYELVPEKGLDPEDDD